MSDLEITPEFLNSAVESTNHSRNVQVNSGLFMAVGQAINKSPEMADEALVIQVVETATRESSTKVRAATRFVLSKIIQKRSDLREVVLDKLTSSLNSPSRHIRHRSLRVLGDFVCDCPAGEHAYTAFGLIEAAKGFRDRDTRAVAERVLGVIRKRRPEYARSSKEQKQPKKQREQAIKNTTKNLLKFVAGS